MNYTGKDRVRAALKGDYADAVPVSVTMGSVPANLAGFTIREFLTDVGKNIKSLLAFHERFKPDTVNVGLGPMVVCETLGNEVEFPENSHSRIKSHFLEDKRNLPKLKIPDPKGDKRMPDVLELCERAKAVITDSTLGCTAGGPWNFAIDLRGMEQLILDTMDDPAFVHELMRFTTEVAKVWGSAIRATGIGISMAEASASCSVISPKIYKEFVKPYHTEIVNYFKERKTWLSLHICGYVDPIMEDIVSEGYGSLSIDSPSSLKKLVEVSQKKAMLISNVDTTLFAEGTKEEIEAAVKECLRVARPGSRYVLTSGCELPLNATVDRIDYFMEVGRKYARYENLEALL